MHTSTDSSKSSDHRILVIDDDVDFADSIQDLLETQGYDVDAANNPKDAMIVAERFQPEIALIDVKLGLTSGVDLLKPLRKLLPEIQCVLVTGYASMDSVIEGLRYYASDYLQKPVSAPVLWATIDRCIRFVDLEREREQAQIQLLQAQKMQAIGQLTGGIAHDFNNMLQGILGNADLLEILLKEGKFDSLAGHIRNIQLTSHRATELIAQMLVYSRGSKEASRVMELPPAIESIVRLLRGSLPATLALTTNYPNNLPLVQAQSVHLHQLVMNLCINARDALNGESGTITISLREIVPDGPFCASCAKPVTGRYVELSIKDSGEGIDADVLRHIFDPFFSTKELGDAKSSGSGTGMGLAVVHGLMHEYGGHVLVETSPGKGCNFQLLFPALEETAVAAVPTPGPPEITETAEDETQGRIMVVDDESIVTQFLQDLLEMTGYDVVVYNDPEEALAYFESGPSQVDLVITDQTMPNLSGDKLAKALLARRADLPVILCTGYSEQVDAQTCQEIGIKGFLRKPFGAGPVLALLGDLLPAPDA